MKYVTKRLPNETELRVKANYGSFDQADGIVALSTPIGDMFKVGVAGARLSRGGFGRNTNLNIDNYNKDIWAGRGTIEFESPDTRLFVRITGDYTHDLSNPRNGHRLIPACCRAPGAGQRVRYARRAELPEAGYPGGRPVDDRECAADRSPDAAQHQRVAQGHQLHAD